MLPVLPKRLQAIANAVLLDQPMADIGTDHALLPAYLLATGRVPSAIASDLRAGPLEAAGQTLRRYSVEAAELRRGCGLAVLRPREVSTIVVAGMGGGLIARLLQDAPEIVASTQRVIVQPNTEWARLRSTLEAQRWPIVDEDFVEESQLFYPIIVVEPHRPFHGAWTEADRLLGPHLRRSSNAALRRFVEQRMVTLERIVARLRVLKADARRLEVERELELLRGERPDANYNRGGDMSSVVIGAGSPLRATSRNTPRFTAKRARRSAELLWWPRTMTASRIRSLSVCGAMLIGIGLVALPRKSQAAVSGKQGIEIEGAMDRRGFFGGFGVGGGASLIENTAAFGYTKLDVVLGGGVTKNFTLAVNLHVDPFFQERPAVGFGGDIEGTVFVFRGLFLRFGAGALGYSRSPARRDSGVVGGIGGKAGLGYEFFLNSTAAIGIDAGYDIRAVPGHGFNQGGFLGFRFLWY